ncbi:MAG TPA: hypothetical protein VEA17_19275, partial [Bordetella sp.]|nr:hypothetical protein [Bordetella sp.]
MRAKSILRSIFLGALLSGGSVLAHEWPSPGDAAGSAGPAGQTKPAASLILFENVRVFDGTSATLSGPSNVLVRGNLIEKVSA